MTSAERVGSAASASDDGRRSGGGRGERVRFVGVSLCISCFVSNTNMEPNLVLLWSHIYDN